MGDVDRRSNRLFGVDMARHKLRFMTSGKRCWGSPQRKKGGVNDMDLVILYFIG